MRHAYVDDINEAFEVALEDVHYGGIWVGQKKEITDYVVEIGDTDVPPDDKYVNELDNWHGEDHFKVTAGWTFPPEVTTNLKEEPGQNDNAGDYYERLIQSEKGNQIQNMVDTIEDWGRNNRTIAQVYQADKDLNQMYPPCLLHIQALFRQGAVSLSAAYRSHTLAKSYLGDLVGLCRLQRYLCEETDSARGKLVVHSGSLHYRKDNDEHKLAENLVEEVFQ